MFLDSLSTTFYVTITYTIDCSYILQYLHGLIVSVMTNLHLSTVRFKRENPDLSLLDLKFRNMQGFGANMEISFMKYGSFMQKFAPFETFVKIT